MDDTPEEITTLEEAKRVFLKLITDLQNQLVVLSGPDAPTHAFTIDQTHQRLAERLVSDLTSFTTSHDQQVAKYDELIDLINNLSTFRDETKTDASTTAQNIDNKLKAVFDYIRTLPNHAAMAEAATATQRIIYAEERAHDDTRRERNLMQKELDTANDTITTLRASLATTTQNLDDERKAHTATGTALRVRTRLYRNSLAAERLVNRQLAITDTNATNAHQQLLAEQNRHAATAQTSAGKDTLLTQAARDLNAEQDRRLQIQQELQAEQTAHSLTTQECRNKDALVNHAAINLLNERNAHATTQGLLATEQRRHDSTTTASTAKDALITQAALDLAAERGTLAIEQDHHAITKEISQTRLQDLQSARTDLLTVRHAVTVEARARATAEQYNASALENQRAAENNLRAETERFSVYRGTNMGVAAARAAAENERDQALEKVRRLELAHTQVRERLNNVETARDNALEQVETLTASARARQSEFDAATGMYARKQDAHNATKRELAELRQQVAANRSISDSFDGLTNQLTRLGVISASNLASSQPAPDSTSSQPALGSASPQPPREDPFTDPPSASQNPGSPTSPSLDPRGPRAGDKRSQGGRESTFNSPEHSRRRGLLNVFRGSPRRLETPQAAEPAARSPSHDLERQSPAATAIQPVTQQQNVPQPSQESEAVVDENQDVAAPGYVSPNDASVRQGYVIINVRNPALILASVLDQSLKDHVRGDGGFAKFRVNMRTCFNRGQGHETRMSRLRRENRPEQDTSTPRCYVKEYHRRPGPKAPWRWDEHDSNIPCQACTQPREGGVPYIARQCLKVVDENTLWLLNPAPSDFDDQARHDRENAAAGLTDLAPPADSVGGVALGAAGASAAGGASPWQQSVPRSRFRLRHHSGASASNTGLQSGAPSPFGEDATHDTIVFHPRDSSSPVENQPQGWNDRPLESPGIFRRLSRSVSEISLTGNRIVRSKRSGNIRRPLSGLFSTEPSSHDHLRTEGQSNRDTLSIGGKGRHRRGGGHSSRDAVSVGGSESHRNPSRSEPPILPSFGLPSRAAPPQQSQRGGLAASSAYPEGSHTATTTGHSNLVAVEEEEEPRQSANIERWVYETRQETASDTGPGYIPSASRLSQAEAESRNLSSRPYPESQRHRDPVPRPFLGPSTPRPLPPYYPLPARVGTAYEAEQQRRRGMIETLHREEDQNLREAARERERERGA